MIFSRHANVGARAYVHMRGRSCVGVHVWGREHALCVCVSA